MTEPIQPFSNSPISGSPCADEAVLSPLACTTGVFYRPTRVFESLTRRPSWWLPFLLSVLVIYGFYFTVTAKVGWNQVYQNNLRLAPKQAQQLESLQPEQRASAEKFGALAIQYTFLGMPLLFLLFTAIEAAVLLGTMNFVFGGRATFWKVYAVAWYAGLPGLIKFLLSILALLVGLDPESLQINNPAGTNLAYYLSPTDTPKAFYALATQVDATMLWTLVLLGIGVSIVAGTKRSSGLTAVFAWWIVIVLLSVGSAVAFS